MDSRCTCSNSSLAQVAHHALAEQGGEHRLAVGAAEGERRATREQEGGVHRHGRIARRQRDVDHALREERPDELEQPFRHQQHERAGDEPPVRPHVHA